MRFGSIRKGLEVRRVPLLPCCARLPPNTVGGKLPWAARDIRDGSPGSIESGPRSVASHRSRSVRRAGPTNRYSRPVWDAFTPGDKVRATGGQWSGTPRFMATTSAAARTGSGTPREFFPVNILYFLLFGGAPFFFVTQQHFAATHLSENRPQAVDTVCFQVLWGKW